MVEPKPYTHHTPNKTKPVQEAPKRELRRRSQIDRSGTIQVSAISNDELNPQDEVKGALVPSSEGPTEKILVTAKSGRPYNMWPGQFFPHLLFLSNLANRLQTSPGCGKIYAAPYCRTNGPFIRSIPPTSGYAQSDHAGTYTARGLTLPITSK